MLQKDGLGCLTAAQYILANKPRFCCADKLSENWIFMPNASTPCSHCIRNSNVYRVKVYEDSLISSVVCKLTSLLAEVSTQTSISLTLFVAISNVRGITHMTSGNSRFSSYQLYGLFGSNCFWVLCQKVTFEHISFQLN